MSTQTLLEQVVVVAGEEVRPQICVMDEMVTRLKKIKPALRTEDEKEILKLANAKSRNLPLVNLQIAIKAAGAGKEGFPKLALAPYEFSFQGKLAGVTVHADGDVSFHDPDQNRWRGYRFNFPGALPPISGMFESWKYPVRAQTVVPLVPPELRKAKTENLVVLFEADEWRPIPRRVDPYLLRYVAGNIYAVIGTWEVSETEFAAFQTARNLGI